MSEKTGPAPIDDPVPRGNRDPGESGPMRGNWLESIFGLIESRAAIISLEAEDAFGSALGRIIPLLICFFCVFAAWVLTVAGAIGCLTVFTDWEWYQVTFAMAGLHILIAVVALLIAKAKKPAPFPVTRAEFEKDREWLVQLKNRNN